MLILSITYLQEQGWASLSSKQNMPEWAKALYNNELSIYV